MVAISESERHRILEIISAVESNDWQRFKFLSDEPFPSEESMFEQFENSRKKVAAGFGFWEKDASAEILDDGTRFIVLLIEPRSDRDQQVILSLHNDADRIAIWTFLEQMDWSENH